MEKLRIGQMAALNFVSVQTLRHYEEIGLLVPDEVDGATGYRYYDIRQSARLDMIQYLKAMGMSLNQIKEQLDKQDLEVIKHLLTEHRGWLEKQMAEYRLKHQAVQRCLHNFERYASARTRGGHSLHSCRTVAFFVMMGALIFISTIWPPTRRFCGN